MPDFLIAKTDDDAVGRAVLPPLPKMRATGARRERLLINKRGRYQANREELIRRAIERSKQRQITHPELVREQRAADYVRHRDNRLAKGRNSRYKRVYGITAVEYERLLDSQGGVCAVCGCTDKSGRRLAVDHNHQTGVVRGLLCGRCNKTIGQVEENINILESMQHYLRSGDASIRNM